MDARTADEAALMFFALGFLATSTLVARGPSPISAAVADRAIDDLASPAAPDLARMSARELRRLSGLGRARAESVAQARFERGLGAEPRSYDAVHGIGPSTVESLRRDLEALKRGFPRDARGAYTARP